MTLNGCTAHYCTNDASFEANHEYLKKDIDPYYQHQNGAQGLYFQAV